jgi:hypothetical protein
MNQLHVMCAMLGVSNMGQKVSIEDVSRCKKNPDITIWNATLAIGQRYMESDEHLEMFADEAKSFKSDLQKNPDECRKWWPDIFEMYEKA